MRVLLTGGAGRLGMTICKAMMQEGLQVRIFDLDNTRNRKNIKSIQGKAEVFWGDITRPESVRAAMEGVDGVVHMAAILPPVAQQKPELAHKVNVGGTRIMVDLLKEKGGHIPFIFTSSAAAFGPTPNATEPLDADRHEPQPKDVYGETKLQAEGLIRESGIDYIILRLTATLYFIFEPSDVKRMFSIPLNNRIEHCHPDDTACAIVNSIKRFDTAKGNTLVVSGGPRLRMLYKDLVGGILKVMGLPLPPAIKFTKKPYYLDWYDTSKAQKLLRYQQKSFSDYLNDYSRELSRVYGSWFLPFMRRFVGPVFGKLIVRFF